MPSAQDEVTQGESGISSENLTALVRAIIATADLSKLTKRMVRNSVIESLGPRTPPNTAAFRTAVSKTISAVITEQSAASPPAASPAVPNAGKGASPKMSAKGPPQPPSPSSRPKPRKRRVVIDEDDDSNDNDNNNDNENTEDATDAKHTEKDEEKKKEENISPQPKHADNRPPAINTTPEHGSSSNTNTTDLTGKSKKEVKTSKTPHSAIEDNTDKLDKPLNLANVKPSSKKEEKNHNADAAQSVNSLHGVAHDKAVDSDDSDDDFALDSEDEPVASKRKRIATPSSSKQPQAKRARPTLSPSPPPRGEPEDDLSSDDYNEGADDPRKKVAKIAKKPRESELARRSTDGKVGGAPRAPKAKAQLRPKQTADQAKVDQLNGVLRGLGLRVPPRNYKNREGDTKSDVIVAFLRTKGVNNERPWLLTKREVERHRARIEREKDLAGLDASNIIDDGQRARRRRRSAPLKIKEPEIDLPSDLSGQELSASDKEEENDGGEYNADSDESG